MSRRAFMQGGGGLLCGSFLEASLPNRAYAHHSGIQYVVFDPDNNTVLLELNAHHARQPASLTKMMTGLLVFEAIRNPKTTFNLSTHITVPRLTRDLVPIGSGIKVFPNVRTGQSFTTHNLLVGMGGRSDAYSSITLAVHLGHDRVYGWGGNERDKYHRFIDLMNEKAHEIGMRDTNFVNVTGRPASGHRSTPYDMAVLMHYMHTHYPNLSESTFGQPSFNIRPLSAESRHTSRFIRQNPNQAEWGKTGWTNAAGLCLGVQYNKDGKRLIGVVFGARSSSERRRVMADILNQGYDLLEQQERDQKANLLTQSQHYG